MSSLVFHTHSGLGDSIITNGMAHAFSDSYDKIYIAHLSMFTESFEALYKNFPKIIPVKLPDQDINLYQLDKIKDLVKATKSEYVCIGDPYLQYPKRLVLNQDGNLEHIHTPVDFERQMYELAGMHYSIRYTRCQIPDSTDNSKKLWLDLSKGNDYILVHRQGSQSTTGYQLDIQNITKFKHLPIIEIEPGYTNNVFDFVDLIKNAKEIHVVGSFFFTLVDSMFDKTLADLYYHSILKKHESRINSFWNNFRWTLVDYERKL